MLQGSKLKSIALCVILALCLHSTEGDVSDQNQAVSHREKGRGGFLAATGSFRLSGLVPREEERSLGERNVAELDSADDLLDDKDDDDADALAIHTSLGAASGLESGTDGSETTCSSVLEGISPGDIDCNAWNPVSMDAENRGCFTDTGWKTNAADCQKYFGDSCLDKCTPTGGHGSAGCTISYCDAYKPGGNFRSRCTPTSAQHQFAIDECAATCGLCGSAAASSYSSHPKCPDGIGPNGVYITGHFGPEDSGYCAAWDSPAAARGYMDCTPDGSTCTTITVKKGHMMSPSAGIFMLKRIKCNSDGCKVFKLGECFDVSPEKPFKNCNWGQDNCIFTDGNSYEATKLEQDTQAFAKLVLDQLRADTAKECTDTDNTIGQNLIKSS